MSQLTNESSDDPSFNSALIQLSPDQPFTIVTSTRVVFPSAQTTTPGTIIISPESGKILYTFPTHNAPSTLPPHITHHDVSPHIILPGLIDTHVHLNDPGRAEWEGFWTGTRAALAGGITTIIDMPLNSIPPTVSVDALDEKVRAAEGRVWCNVGFYGGIVPSNVGKGELKRMVKRGVKGFKGFMCESGVDEFEMVGEKEVRSAMEELEGEGVVCMFHAEVAGEVVEESEGRVEEYRTFLNGRPTKMETDAIARIISLVRDFPPLHAHIVHLSTAEGIPLLREARQNRINITAETCHHYLTLTADDIQNGDARCKCCPPVRDKANQELLWQELLRQDSVIETIVSDHSPCVPELKRLPSHIPGSVATDSTAGNFSKAWGGITSLGLGLPLLNTQRQRRETFGLADIVRWCVEDTAKQVGLQNSKGKLSSGFDADIVVFDDSVEWTVDARKMHWKNKLSAYDGLRLTGAVRQTWLAGKRKFDYEGGFIGPGPNGKLLLD